MIQLLQGDCLEIMPTLAAGSVDMVLCDLPYGTTACKWDHIINPAALWVEYERLSAASAALVFTASQPFTTVLVGSHLPHFRYCWVWEKTMATGGLMARTRPLKAHEDIAVFYREQPTYNPQRGEGTPYTRKEGNKRGSIIGDKDGGYVTDNSQGGRSPRSVIKVPNPNHGSVHPTQKPVALMEYLIRTYTNPGDVVLDNCMGSGTTGVACVNTGRSFIGIEKDAGYFAIASERLKEAQQRAALTVPVTEAVQLEA
jgi:site-specific DNA-methyltransferase (adenine-specific)